MAMSPADGGDMRDYFDFEALTSAELGEAAMIPNSLANENGTVADAPVRSKGQIAGLKKYSK